MTASTRNDLNRHWVLNKRPEGNNFEEALSLEEGPVPDCPKGGVLVRTLHLSMDAGTRMWMTAREDAYQPPIPLGNTMEGVMIGEIAETDHPGFSEGDRVRGRGMWADYAAIVPEEGYLEVLPDEPDIPLPAFLALFGPNGWTAHVGLFEVGEAKAGDTVLVSAAAGATGTIVCQLAKNAGCRVLGFTSNPDKAKFLEQDVGIDQAINYRADNLDELLKEAAPEGVSVYFDNVGGELLDVVLQNLAMYGRIALCGLVSEYAKEGRNYGLKHYDQLLMKRGTLKGFFSPDFFDQCAEIEADLIAAYKAGDLTFWLDEVDGLENALGAYAKLFESSNIGKVMVKI
ncbi:MAG: NADP-dependent oxidoreductase [Alphaproteobacteria bacterium]|nr:NADP-dependent oxidoreductase [Alphaproteobacteria bacterium]